MGVRRVTLLLSPNGSLVLVPEDASTDGSPSLSGVAGLLVATFVGGLSLNLLLGAAHAALLSTQGGLSALSRPRAAHAAHALLVLANALDCLLNVPSAALIVSSWSALSERSPRAARALCRVSASSGQLTSILQTLSVLVLVLDGCLSVVSAPSSSSSSLTLGSKRLARWGSVASWGALGLALPLAAGLAIPVASSAQVRIFPTRYACGLGSERPGGLAVTILVVGYLLPWTAMALGLSVAARAAQQQRWRRRQLELAAQQQGRPGPGQGLDSRAEASSPPGPHHLSLDALLLAMYVAMLLPGILSVQVLQVSPLHRRPELSAGDPMWPVTTGTYETVFVWLRMQFAVVSPGVIVIFSRDVRQKVLEMVQCLCCCGRRGNAVAHSVPPRTLTLHMHPVARDPWTRLRRRRHASSLSSEERPLEMAMVSPRTPVLFATSQGLHLRTLRARDGADLEDADDVSTSLEGGGRLMPRRRGSEAPLPLHSPTSLNAFDPAWADHQRELQHARYVFQFCDLAVLEDPVKASSSDYSSLSSTGQAPITRHKAVAAISQPEPSLTREELQASLGKTRSLSNSSRKNVRFASVVSEIPCALLERVPEQTELPAEAPRSPPCHGTPCQGTPVRYVATLTRTRSLEMALVSGESNSLPPPTPPLPLPPLLPLQLRPPPPPPGPRSSAAAAANSTEM